MKIITFLHVLTAIVGFGGVFLNGIYARSATGLPAAEGLAVLETNRKASKVSEWMIYATGVFGLVLAGMEPTLFKATWLSISMLLYIVYVVLLLAVVQPSSRKLTALYRSAAADGGEVPATEADSLNKKVSITSGINHLLFALVLLLMVAGPVYLKV